MNKRGSGEPRTSSLGNAGHLGIRGYAKPENKTESKVNVNLQHICETTEFFFTEIGPVYMEVGDPR